MTPTDFNSIAYALGYAFDMSTLTRRHMDQITTSVIDKLQHEFPEMDAEKFRQLIFPN